MAFLGTNPREMAPNYLIKVSGIDIGIGVTDLIDKVSYESADGMADVLKVTVMNPKGAITDSKIFGIGNEIELWGGYGPNLEFIGAAVINGVRARFPGEGQPMLNVVGYTRDKEMMDNEPPEGKKGKKAGKKGKGGRVFKGDKFSDAVIARAQDYKFGIDVDETPDKPHEFIQKSGMNDYEFVQGLANLTGFTFWVDRTAAGKWILHFKNPTLVTSLQTKKFKFSYDTEFASLLDFTPEMTFSGAYTKIVAHVKNARTGKLLKTEVVDGKVGKDNQYRGDPKDKIIEPPPSGGGIKLFLGEFSLDVQTTKKFRTEKELSDWALQWFRRNRDNFVLASGRTIGIETLFARSVHEISNTAKLYDGDYQFDRVTHVFDSGGGYVTNWHGRKVLEAA